MTGAVSITFVCISGVCYCYVSLLLEKRLTVFGMKNVPLDVGKRPLFSYFSISISCYFFLLFFPYLFMLPVWRVLICVIVYCNALTHEYLFTGPTDRVMIMEIFEKGRAPPVLFFK